MRFTQGQLVGLALTAWMAAGAGCGGEAPGEPTEGIQQKLVTGFWSENLRDGDLGPDPFIFFAQDIACEVYMSGDNSYHTGKYVNSTCRIEWADQVVYGRNYRILQNPPSGSYSFANRSVNPPANAVSGDSTTEYRNGVPPRNGGPLCLAAGDNYGKFGEFTCRFEWGDRVFKYREFQWVVYNP
jgi:hypothetical protein